MSASTKRTTVATVLPYHLDDPSFVIAHRCLDALVCVWLPCFHVNGFLGLRRMNAVVTYPSSISTTGLGEMIVRQEIVRLIIGDNLSVTRVHQRKRAAGRADVHRPPMGTVGVAVAVGLGVTVEVGVGVTVGVTVGVAVAVAVGVGVGLEDARVLKVLSPP